MATLHMDTDRARTVLSGLIKTQNEISTILQTNTNNLAKFQTNWIGSSSDKFFTEYLEISNQMLQSNEKLKELSKFLEHEISEWESIASRLG
jgi:WXG100 family type VII secretion target